MNFASKGLSWAENLYQKLEKACAESDVVKIPCRYVDQVSDHVKHVLDELTCDHVYPSDDESVEPVSSTKHDNVTESYDKSRIESIGSSEKVEDLDHQKLFNACMKSTLVEATGSTLSDGAGEMYTNLEPDVFSSGNLSLVTSCSTKSFSTEGSELKISDSSTKSFSTEGSELKISDSSTKSFSTEGSELKLSDGSTKEDPHNEESINSSNANPCLDDVDQFVSQQNTCDERNRQSFSTKDLESKCSANAGDSSKNAEPIVYSFGDLRLVTSLDAKELLTQLYMDNEHGFNRLLKQAKTSDSLAITQEKCTDISNSVVTCADVRNPLALSRRASPSESHQNELIEEGSIRSHTTSSVETHGDSHMERMLSTTDSVHPTKVLVESYEDVDLDAFWDEAENFELVVNPNHLCKNASEKKLKHPFISKFLAGKRTKNEHRIADEEMPDRLRVDASEIPDQCFKISVTQDSCGSDWVLL